MDLRREAASRDSSSEDPRKTEAVKEGTEDRASRLVAKANPLARAETSCVPQPSVSSGVTGRHSQPPSLPSLPGDLSCSHHGLLRPRGCDVLSPCAEVDPMLWAPYVTSAWVLFPDEEAPVFGWFREGASPHRDAFFGSDGAVRNLPCDLFAEFRLLLPVGEGALRPKRRNYPASRAPPTNC